MIGRWPLSWSLARRFRRKQERSGFLSFISASSTLGIALGSMVLIAGLSVMNGFETMLEQRFLSLVPQVEFTAVKGTLRDPEDVIRKSLAHPQVIAARPVIRTQAMVQQGTRFTGVQVEGIATDQQRAITDYMDDEVWSTLQQTPRGVVLGKQLAADLKLSKGDSVTLLVAEQGSFREPRRIRLELLGTFSFGGQVDHQYAYVNLDTARDLIGVASGVTSVELEVRDIFAAQQVANEVGHELNDYLYLDHWMRSQGHLYRDIQLVRLVMYLVLVLVLAVASFNIVSTLIMTVQEKQRHIGILRTMGLRQSAVLRIFIWQGLQNGLLGIIIGAIGGIGLSLALPDLMKFIEYLTGRTILASDVYFVSEIPVSLQWQDVVLVSLIAVVMSALATLYPAWYASRTQVIQAIQRS
ncbi:ABC transporter permease [Pseudidiomarina salinarum]|uniref:ABC transporter permease n=1 Tax=Pseudidiomarina salinarum TaxID=435908 RepID=A0A094IY99_9GAMM|nr:lipoprotein-releasing ABC transporter permease subunit [Pseudidiomarina salinarum]KFZ32087.1 ABC transporter permease [Pseudidiomarina salinarum]RUO70133.1 lipoprotein-releasing system transmembrane subunit, LolC/LolE family [Pseudidiomarina salinarum]